jgi:ABC-type branched-subunit amino acid transport system ATPase component/ABC-type branched-subunit amino acid transport system permease subunit
VSETEIVADGLSPSTRSPATTSTLWYRRFAVLGILVVALTAYVLGVSEQYLYVGCSALVAAIGAIGLTVLTGTAGQVSIGNAAFMGLGAYTVVLLGGHVPFLLAVVLGGAVAAVVGAAIGVPSLRLRGMYLAFSTLALQYTISFALQQYDNDTDAMAGHTVGTATIGPIVISSGRQWYVFLVCAVAVVTIATHSVVSGRPGRAWDAVRTNEVTAAIMGVDVTRAKISAFVYSSFLIGMSGAILAYFVGNISADYFSLSLAVSYVAMVLIGGSGSLGGAIAGAIVVTALPTVTTSVGTAVSGAASGNGYLGTNLPAIDAGIYGLLILLFMFFQPAGLAGLFKGLTRRFAPLCRGDPHRPEDVSSDTSGGDGESAIRSPSTLRTKSPGVGDLVGDTFAADTKNGSAADALLVVQDLGVTYAGGAHGVAGISLVLPAGQVVALVGPNGGGKTSTLRAIAGFPGREASVRATKLTFLGSDIGNWSTRRRARSGMALVPERDKVFSGLTVEEQLRLACDADAATFASRLEEALELLPEIRPHLNRRGGYLSGGQRQMVALASAMCASPALILIDEMTLGLAPSLVNRMAEILRRLKCRRTSLLIAEQSLSLAFDVADVVYVLDASHVVAHGPPAELRRRDDVVEAYVGRAGGTTSGSTPNMR